LAKIGSETAIPGLLKALEDPNSYVREKAVEALSNIKATIPVLILALKHSNENVRKIVAEVLSKIGTVETIN
jgi:HEAT repeat protein